MAEFTTSQGREPDGSWRVNVKDDSGVIRCVRYENDIYTNYASRVEQISDDKFILYYEGHYPIGEIIGTACD